MNKRLLYAMPQLRRPLSLLGGISPQQFMRDYWQKKPLLIRQALPHYAHSLKPQELFELAREDDMEARLISHTKEKWQLKQGPFARLPSRQQRNWTLLLQGINLFHPIADQLLQQFSFLPDARLDDLMASYATPGGGVGPHFDSYDVFLLQVHGQREWQISAQADLTLEEDMPLKILRRFKAEQTWVLSPGDMLYLPPHIAHNGVAVDECITCSIGFRAPTYAELADGFFSELSETLSEQAEFCSHYADPKQTAVSNPAQLPPTMVKKVSEQLRKISWQSDQVSQFLGRYLSEPKANVFFDPPEQLLTSAQFKRALRKQTLALSLRSRGLYDEGYFYLNGEMTMLPTDESAVALLRSLADQRSWSAAQCAALLNSADLLDLAYLWFSYGWLELSE